MCAPRQKEKNRVFLSWCGRGVWEGEGGQRRSLSEPVGPRPRTGCSPPPAPIRAGEPRSQRSTGGGGFDRASGGGLRGPGARHVPGLDQSIQAEAPDRWRALPRPALGRGGLSETRLVGGWGLWVPALPEEVQRTQPLMQSLLCPCLLPGTCPSFGSCL